MYCRLFFSVPCLGQRNDGNAKKTIKFNRMRNAQWHGRAKACLSFDATEIKTSLQQLIN
jgi:hypothetical protein